MKHVEIWRVVAPMLVAASLSGCAARLLDPDIDSPMTDDQVSLTGSKMVVGKEPMARVNLGNLICLHLPDGARTKLGDCAKEDDTPARLSAALAAFNDCYGLPGSLRNTALGCSPVAAPGESTRQFLYAYAVDVRAAVANMKGLVDQLSAEIAAIETASASGKPAPSLTEAKQIHAELMQAYQRAVLSLEFAQSSAGTVDPATTGAAFSQASQHLAAVAEQAKRLLPPLKVPSASSKVGAAAATATQTVSTLLAAAEQAKARVSMVVVSPDDRAARGMLARTSIQETIIMAADRRCEIAKQVITSAKSEANFLTTMFSSVAGIAGTLVSDGAARYFSGTAGGVSAIGASWDNAYFQGQTTTLILHGLNTARMDWRNKVIGPKRSLSLQEYSLQEAIGHALQYNAECSVPAALQAINQELHKTPDVSAAVGEQMARMFRRRCAEEEARGKKGEELKKALDLCKENAKVYKELVIEDVEDETKK